MRRAWHGLFGCPKDQEFVSPWTRAVGGGAQYAVIECKGCWRILRFDTMKRDTSTGLWVEIPTGERQPV